MSEIAEETYKGLLKMQSVVHKAMVADADDLDEKVEMNRIHKQLNEIGYALRDLLLQGTWERVEYLASQTHECPECFTTLAGAEQEEKQ